MTAEPVRQMPTESGVARPPKKKPNRSPWSLEFHKFLHQQVVVEYACGQTTRSVFGKMTGYSGEAHHIIVETLDGNAYFIRLPLEIRRSISAHTGANK